jgi:hypothetical protein
VFTDEEGRLAAESQMPSLVGSNYEPQSNRNAGYNCFAWAIRDSEHFVEPPGRPPWFRWRKDLPTWISLSNYVRFYELEGGFERCEDGSLEEGYEKIALFADGIVPMHAARQLPCGRWTSKLGRGIDVVHDLETLDGAQDMGSLAVFMKRACPGPPPDPPSAVIPATEMPPSPVGEGTP